MADGQVADLVVVGTDVYASGNCKDASGPNAQNIPGYWKMVKSSHEFKKKDAFTLEYELTLPKETTGDKKTVVTLNYNRLNVQNNEPSNY